MRGTWKQAIVVGASSGIGAAVARALAAEGTEVALVARRREELDALAETIAAAGGRARVFPHDVTAYADVPALFQEICRALGGCDLVVYAAGVMPLVADDEYSFAKDQAIIEVNVLGAIAWLNEAAVRFERAGAGTLVGLSSVAGDRGRRGNPVYCASKAALDAYLQALRHRLARRGVAVVTVKPGPVDTPMTRGRDRLPLLISADAAAAAILAAARRGTATAYVPGVWRPIMFAIRNVPNALFNRLDL
jgi:decaprenylphospho-beta-D-erythro-pentofuranosid-2-ulose 2-reductase